MVHQARAQLDSARPTNACVFCEIIAGSVAADLVFRDERSVAFLDRSPLFKGHVLVVPVDHIPTLAELPSELIAPFFALVQRISTALPVALAADGSFVAINNVVSQSVAHLHVHVVPRRRKDGLRGFFWPREKYSDHSDATAIAALIRARLAT